MKTRAKPTAAAAPPPANDDWKPALKETVVVTVTSRKQMKLRRAERGPESDDDPEAEARVKAFFARVMQPP